MTEPVLRAVAKMREDGFDVSPSDVRAALSAAFNVDEMAAAAWAHDYSYPDTTLFKYESSSQQDEYRRLITDLRAFLLGEDQ